MLTACLVSFAVSACGFGGVDSTSDDAQGALADVSESVPGKARGTPPVKRGSGTATDPQATSETVMLASLSTDSTVSGVTTTDTAAGSDDATITLAQASTGPTASSSSSALAEPWVDTLVNDMKLYHDAPVAVLETLPGWGSGANWPEATPRPSGWKYAIPWTHTIEDTSHVNGNGYPWRVPGPYTGNQAPNTRVQQRDIQMWWLLSDGRWVLGTHNPRPGDSMFPLNWAEGTQIEGRDIWRDESANGGGSSMRSIGRDAYARHLWHEWASPHRIPDNAIGAVTVFFSRLILDDPKGPDDRHLAHILSAGAGDWYKDDATLTSPKVPGVNTTYMGIARLKYVTKDWQLFGWTSLSEAQIRANPPPVIGLPQ